MLRSFLFAKNVLLFVFVSFLSIEVTNSKCFSDDLFEIRLKTGSSFYHECRCLNTSSDALIRWLDINDKEIEPLGPGSQSNIYTEGDRHGRSLFIPSVTKTTSGLYKCVAKEDGAVNIVTFNVEAYDPMYFFNARDNQNVVKDTNSLVRCEARGDRDPEINWYREKMELIEIYKSEKYDLKPEGLYIKNVTDEDGGIYKCTAAVFETGEVIEKTIQVEVVTTPSIEEIKVFPNKTVLIGDSVSLECIADGLPRPRYTWNKISEKGLPETNISWVRNVNTLSKLNVTPEDRGMYECIAYNEGGLVKKEVFIEVQVPPTIIEFNNITVAEGSTAQIVCKAEGRPRPKISVLHEQPGLDEDTRIIWDSQNINETEQVFHLSFTPVARSHEGFYHCNASNEVDMATETLYMTVLHKPYFSEEKQLIWGWKGKPVNLSCENESNPPAEISWRYQGNDIPTEDQVEINKIIMQKLNSPNNIEVPMNIVNKAFYGVYECTAKNDFGMATKVITLKEAFIPTPILNATLIERTATSAIFNITPPLVIEGPPILGFMAEYDQLDNYNITDIHLNRTWAIDRQFKIDRLKPDTVYRVRFAAINEVGTGVWSEEEIEFDTPERSAPDEPMWDESIEAAAFTEIYQNKITLKWRTPEHNGEPIDYYIIKYCTTTVLEEFSVCKEHLVASSNELELNDLEPNTTYYLELVAHNSEGNSTSATTFITTPMITLEDEELKSVLSAGAIIAVSVITVFICLIILDVLLLLWRRKGIIASCCRKKKKNEKTLSSRDRKGLLKENSDPVDESMKRTPHSEDYGYKHTGVITGKHSAV